ncbi:CAP-Gly domain protein [Mesorhizobium sp. ESP-6-4]|uniref:CAP-Gly domain protein n=1 Tax=Mesorhizobium sp. ESP-6-4 TaxID=2876624 RepID=UPI001CC90F0C|nr:CAP-Gly domain protein [Mesorhizobium sp. ESP-6-4]MBZ9659740.1 CAP-Gly domain protein [Mesorhizobium sp. ESP-6-4]
MSWDFYPGQEVICVDAKSPPRVTIPLGLVEGQTYVLRWVGEYDNYVDGPFIGVRLVGVNRGKDPTYGFEDPPYNAKRFRPLIKNPIAFARRIAADPNQQIDAPEGPVRGKPVREGAPKRKKEEV